MEVLRQGKRRQQELKTISEVTVNLNLNKKETYFTKQKETNESTERVIDERIKIEIEMKRRQTNIQIDIKGILYKTE